MNPKKLQVIVRFWSTKTEMVSVSCRT